MTSLQESQSRTPIPLLGTMFISLTFRKPELLERGGAIELDGVEYLRIHTERVAPPSWSQGTSEYRVKTPDDRF
jgi:hypothetical protein